MSVVFLNAGGMLLCMSMLRLWLMMQGSTRSYLFEHSDFLQTILSGFLADAVIVAVCTVVLLGVLWVFRAPARLVYRFIGLCFFLGAEVLLLTLTLLDAVYFFTTRIHLDIVYTAHLGRHVGLLGDSIGNIYIHIAWLGVITLCGTFFSTRAMVKRLGNGVKIKFVATGLVCVVVFFSSIFLKNTFAPQTAFAQQLATNFVIGTFQSATLDCGLASLNHRAQNYSAADSLVGRKYAAEKFVSNDYPLVKMSRHHQCTFNQALSGDPTCDVDSDNDGYSVRTDCDDESATIFPGAHEVEYNGVDENCDGIDNPARNVVWIFLESFGAHNISERTTPFLHSLMQAHDSWTQFYSNGVDTASSLVSSLCSLLPSQGWTDLHSQALTPNRCLPTILNEHGYSTLLMQAGDLDFLDKKPFFTTVGFDMLFGKDDMESARKTKWGVSDEALYEHVGVTLAEIPEPFFATIYTLAVHHPYAAPPDGVEVYPHDSFPHRVYNLMAYADRQLETFWNNNKNEEWFKNTVFVITADNGQPLGLRHGNVMSYAAAYQDNIAIPLVIIDPRTNKGRQHTSPGSQIDLAPSVLDLLGIDAPNAFQGSSMFDGGDTNTIIASASALGRCQVAYQEGNMKAIGRWGSDSVELYDLNQDWLEKHNLAHARPDLAGAYRKKIEMVILQQQALYMNDRIWPTRIEQLFKE